MGGRLNELRDQIAALGAWLFRNLSLLVIFALVFALIASESARYQLKRQSGDYEDLWNRERIAHRHTINLRLSDLEEQIAAIPTDGVPTEYQDRLAVVRQRFDSFLHRPQPPAAYPAVRVPVAPTPRPSDEAAPAPVRCTMTDEQAAEALLIRQQLIDLQAWVTANSGARP